MRKLLVILALVGLTCAVGAWDAPAAEAASYSITAFTFHPVGGGSYHAILDVGWHEVGDCIHCPDANPHGLDWTWENDVSTLVRVRLWNWGGPSAITRVANMYSYYTTYPCKRIVSEVKRLSDGGVFGSVVNQHSYREGTYSTAVYSRSSGYQNTANVGYMVPYQQDNCLTTANHTMQWYESGDHDTGYGKDTGIPTECQCCVCATPYDVWNAWEYYFDFHS
jgi:hypothetical protein